MTDHEKEMRLIRYKRGDHWLAPAPDVCTARWGDKDWARFVTFDGPYMRFYITGMDKHGLRSIQHNGMRGKGWDTETEAEKVLEAMRENNGGERLASFFHDHKSLRVDEMPAYDHGDPKGVYVQVQGES